MTERLCHVMIIFTLGIVLPFLLINVIGFVFGFDWKMIYLFIPVAAIIHMSGFLAAAYIIKDKL